MIDDQANSPTAVGNGDGVIQKGEAVDLVVAVGIAVFIAYSGYRIVIAAFSVLSDTRMVSPGEVRRLAKSVGGVSTVHGVRSRGLPDDIHVDLRVHVPGEMTTVEAHRVAHEVSRRIREGIAGVTDVVVHVEPEGEHEE